MDFKKTDPTEAGPMSLRVWDMLPPSRYPPDKGIQEARMWMRAASTFTKKT